MTSTTTRRTVLAGGATLLAGGHRSPLGGTFFEPTVLTGVTPQMAEARA